MKNTYLIALALACSAALLSPNSYAYYVNNQAALSSCTTAIQASQMLITGWQMHNRQVAGTCAYPNVVNNLFMTQPSTNPEARWQSNGCRWTGISTAQCSYSFEGGIANLALVRLNTTLWRVTAIQFVAD